MLPCKQLYHNCTVHTIHMQELSAEIESARAIQAASYRNPAEAADLPPRLQALFSENQVASGGGREPGV